MYNHELNAPHLPRKKLMIYFIRIYFFPPNTTESRGYTSSLQSQRGQKGWKRKISSTLTLHFTEQGSGGKKRHIIRFSFHSWCNLGSKVTPRIAYNKYAMLSSSNPMDLMCVCVCRRQHQTLAEDHLLPAAKLLVHTPSYGYRTRYTLNLNSHKLFVVSGEMRSRVPVAWGARKTHQNRWHNRPTACTSPCTVGHRGASWAQLAEIALSPPAYFSRSRTSWWWWCWWRSWW